LKITNKFNLPEPVVLALLEDDYTRGDSNRSVTQIIDAPQARILRDEMDDRVEEDVSDRVWIALGKSMHLLFEKHAHGRWKPEERVEAMIHGWKISGAMDLQVEQETSRVSIKDYKCTSVYSVIFGKASWDEQLNCYAELVERHYADWTLEVTDLSIIVILRDWKKSELKRQGGDYPRSPILEVTIPLWDKKRRAEYIEERVKLHQEAEFMRLVDGPLPPCSDEERWKSPAKCAVKKPANKTAKRVLDSHEEAEQYIADNQLAEKGFVVVPRPSDPKRCSQGWCRIAEWCPQYQRELNPDWVDNYPKEV
jgi:hypothetical protein